MTTTDLRDALAPRILNGSCRAVVANALPPAWGIVIAGAACQFDYLEGGNDVDAKPNANIQGGSAESFYSKRSDGCVSNVKCVLIVSIPNEPNQNLESNQPTPSGECAMDVEFKLSPKNVAQSVLKSGKISDRFELRPAHGRS